MKWPKLDTLSKSLLPCVARGCHLALAGAPPTPVWTTSPSCLSWVWLEGLEIAQLLLQDCPQSCTMRCRLCQCAHIITTFNGLAEARIIAFYGV